MSGLHERLEAVAKGKTYRAIGDATGIHPETVRRYIQGQMPSVEFITALCSALEISPRWLLTGEGPMHVREMRAHALKHADAGELLGAVALTLESLRERMDRVEVYVQTLEARLHAELGDAGSSGGPSKSGRSSKGADDGRAAPAATQRARHVAEAVAKRSRPDAG